MGQEFEIVTTLATMFLSKSEFDNQGLMGNKMVKEVLCDTRYQAFV